MYLKKYFYYINFLEYKCLLVIIWINKIYIFVYRKAKTLST